MTVDDIFKNSHTEQDIASRLKSFNWNYEFSPDLSKIVAGNKQLSILESLVYDLWKRDPSSAIKLWNSNTPIGSNDDSIVPSFIMKRAAQEK
jgi:hypothetical protein